MNMMETVGMMSTGALLALGAMQIFDLNIGGGGSTAPVQAQISAPAAAEPASQAAAPQPAPQVTRAASDLSGVGPVSTADQLASIVQQSIEPLERSDDLTPEQLEVIAFFERSARQLNEANERTAGSLLRFSNMSIDQLNVKYFYQFGQNYGDLRAAELIAEQNRLVRDNVCNTASILTLMTDFDFTYTYTYTSDDHRLVGVVEADASTCS